MSTNYYLHTSPCPLCARPVDVLYIGESSVAADADMCFSLAIHPALGLYGLDDWIPKLVDPDCTITDQHGEVVNPDSLIETIMKGTNG